MPKKTVPELRVEWPQVAAFRLARHHLEGGRAAGVATLCRDGCAMQAQMLSAAYLAPAMLVNGRVAGVWSNEIRGKRLCVAVQPFEKLSAGVRARVSEEAEALGRFLGLSAEVRIAR